MPKKAIDYDNTCFYKRVCNDLNITDCYVGHTTDFRRRKSRHKISCNVETDKAYNAPVYQFIRDNGGWGNFTMVLIEKKPCTCNLEALKEERKHIETLNASLNSLIPYRSVEEMLTMRQQYRNDRQDLKQEYDKHYRHDNGDKKKETDRLYRINNNDKIKANKTQKFDCNVCGGHFTRCHKSEHERSHKHQQALTNLNHDNN